MNKITAIILAKNEEERIADCIDSVSFCDEIILIDNKSTDRTADIARLKEIKVYSALSDGFATNRNLGLKKAKGKWVFYLDADELVTDQLKGEIKRVITGGQTETCAYSIQRKNYYLGNHEWPAIENIVRLFRKNALEGWFGELHETPKVKGEILRLDGYLLHYTHRNLSQMLEKTINWSKVEAELRFKSGHPPMRWWRFPRVMLLAFYTSYIKEKGWKAGTIGLIESIYQAYSMFITYARLWELQIDGGKTDENRNQ